MTSEANQMAQPVPAAAVASEAREAAEASRASLGIPAAFLVVAGLLLAKVLLARYLVLGDADPFSAIVLESAFVLAYLGLVDVVFHRHRWAAYLVADVAVSLVLGAIVVYATYFDRLPAPGMLKLIGQVESVSDSILVLLKPAYLLFIADLPVLFYLGRRYPDRFKDDVQSVRNVGMLAAASAVVAAVCVLATLPSSGGDSIVVARSNGIFGYEIAAATGRQESATRVGQAKSSTPAVANPSDPASVKRAVESIMRPETARRIAGFRRGAYRGANVIVIQAESMQSFPIGLAAEDAVFTPELNEIVSESWYFPNGFTQAGWGTTSDAEFAMNSSLYPPEYGAAVVEYVDRVIPSLPRMLSQAGYDTFTMHANTVRFWNRKELYPALGFSHYYDRSFFSTETVTRFGANDEAMFKMAWPEIKKAAEKGPFYAQILTLAAHHPYNIPDKDVQIALPGWLAGSVVGDYLEAMNYGDRQIGWFINKLKKSGIWDNSIVVIYGDHGGLRQPDLDTNQNRERFELILGHRYTAADMINVPVIVHLPGQTEGVVVTDPVGQVDIMPTVADALGLDLSKTPHFGRDAFESSRVLLVGRGNVPVQSFINDRVVCLAGQDFAQSGAISLENWVPTELRPREKQDWADARTLSNLSDDYVKGLPMRDSQGTSNAIIPGWK